ncbi:hypothetical protein GQX73_g1501 [Xylaria multiplex]|uniref:Zn(2)-C6 fungal-type domain-containing protein n=1 Tax=Xylaria multiplex TaxID=323545 RepID=A0A7C8J6X4_9PEZI|nr:hypothetical protein GQX73_g1501 [Xylaria multiplex]
MTRSGRGCWTCKSRKVQCDQGTPTCQRCAKAQRECEGYELRLSWPRDNDKRRAIRATLPVTSKRAQARYLGYNPFINTTSQDVEFYHRLSLPGTTKPLRSTPPSLNLWRSPQSEVAHTDLLHYFRDAAHYSLATFNPSTSYIRDLIMRMTFTHDTVSRRALFYALLAFSSLHRSGLHRETMLFKVTSLKALSASAKEAAEGSTEAAQHVAACMVLCAFEILFPSESSGEWLWYIRGAMDIIKRARLENQLDGSDGGMLLDWVYYHDSLSRFTLYHWRHNDVTLEAPDTTINPATRVIPYSPLTKERMTSHLQNPPRVILSILSEVWEVLLDPSDPRSQEVEYKDRLRALEWKVDNLPSLSVTTPPADEPINDLEVTGQLYRIAMRIYLARVSRDPIEPPVNLDSLVDSTFAGPVQDCYCRHFFPLLIIACEARTEEQRAAILNLIDRTENSGYVRPMRTFRAQAQSFWLQRDLHADSDLIPNYLHLMRAAISSNSSLPSYA